MARPGAGRPLLSGVGGVGGVSSRSASGSVEEESRRGVDQDAGGRKEGSGSRSVTGASGMMCRPRASKCVSDMSAGRWRPRMKVRSGTSFGGGEAVPGARGRREGNRTGVGGGISCGWLGSDVVPVG